MISKPKTPYVHRIFMLLDNPLNKSHTLHHCLKQASESGHELPLFSFIFSTFVSVKVFAPARTQGSARIHKSLQSSLKAPPK